MSGDHNMNQKKPTIKINGVEINQTTPYIDYDAWMASPLTKALNDRLDAAVLAEREACAKLCDEMERRAEGTECCKWPTPADCAYAIRARGEVK